MIDIAVFAEQAGVPEWDVALVGDGSGRDYGMPGGWGCTLIDRHAANGTAPDARAAFSGGMNRTTADIAELMPYIHAMGWHHHHHGRARRLALGKPVLDVIVITDRTSLVTRGNSIQDGRERVSKVCLKQPLWATIVEFEKHGYRFHWRWVRRETLALHNLADVMSYSARHAAANAMAIALAHVDRDRVSDEEMIYLLNSEYSRWAMESSGIDILKHMRRRRYAAE
jgi:ribonuclease HI